MSVDKGAFPSVESQAVKQVLETINRHLTTSQAGEETEDMVSDELSAIGDKLLALKEVRE